MLNQRIEQTRALATVDWLAGGALRPAAHPPDVSSNPGGIMVLVELKITGSEFAEADPPALKREFGELGAVRVVGSWAPAAGPAVELTTVITFLGGAFTTFVLEKTFEALWLKFGDAWARFREDRRHRGGEDTEFGTVVIRADDLEVIVDLRLDPQSPELTRLMEIVADRLINGALRNLPINSISLPSTLDEDGRWRHVYAEEYDATADEMIWWVQTSTAQGPWGFYDARKDQWLE